MKKRILFNLIFLLFSFIIGYFIFSPIYKLSSVYISYGLFPYDICQKQPKLWLTIKIIFIALSAINILIISNTIFPKFNKSYTNKPSKTKLKEIEKEKLNLLVGKSEKENYVYIPEKGLYQNIIITGTIGSRKNK